VRRWDCLGTADIQDRGLSLAPFLLSHLLLPLLRRGAPARIVNVTGGIPGGRIDAGNLQGERRYLGCTRAMGARCSSR
jgi:hypothetical protein